MSPAATLERWNVIDPVLPDDALAEKDFRAGVRAFLAEGPGKATFCGR
ncbi:MAG TPA: hypothetical protein VHI73_08440 [Solirubrobacteraceae bacterium]|nr:hypothetical protein [Solirubrobacteraceae bacterium]